MIEVEGRVIDKWALEKGVWLATHLRYSTFGCKFERWNIVVDRYPVDGRNDSLLSKTAANSCEL
jgi:hypothetical protein